MLAAQIQNLQPVTPPAPPAQQGLRGIGGGGVGEWVESVPELADVFVTMSDADAVVHAISALVVVSVPGARARVTTVVPDAVVTVRED